MIRSVKQVTHLVSPFIDDWHIDVINEYGHLLTRRWSISCSHPLVDITLNCTLWMKKNASVRWQQTSLFRRPTNIWSGKLTLNLGTVITPRGVKAWESKGEQFY